MERLGLKFATPRPQQLAFRAFDFAALIDSKLAEFGGRQWLFDEIEEAGRMPTGSPGLLILGEPGIGKSSIIAALARRNHERRFSVHHFCQADTPSTLDPLRFVQSVGSMLASSFGGYASVLAAQECSESTLYDAASAFEEIIIAPLRAIDTNSISPGIHYLLIDALDEALLWPEPLNIVRLLSTRLDRLPGWLRVVATSRRAPDVTGRLRGLQVKTIGASDERNIVDVRDYMERRVEDPLVASRLSKDTRREVVDRILAKSGGNFLYARTAVESFARGDFDMKGLSELPPGLGGLYVSFFDWYFPDGERYAVSRQLLEVLVAAREPISRETLAAACSVSLSESFSNVLRLLAPFLERSLNEAGDAEFSLFHKSVAEWLADPENPYHVEARIGDRRLSDAGKEEIQRRQVSRYWLRHLPAHLIACGTTEEVYDLLTSFWFLERCVEAGRVFELLHSFETAVDALSFAPERDSVLRVLAEALRRDAQFIQSHPEALLQSLLNSAYWYDAPGVESYYEDQGEETAIAGPMSALLETWAREKSQESTRHLLLCSHRPPPVALGGALRVLLQHPGGIKSLAISPDGKVLATRGRDLRLWSVSTGRAIEVVEDRDAGATLDTVYHESVLFRPDGLQLVMISTGALVQVRNVTDCAVAQQYFGDPSGIAEVALCNTGGKLAICCGNGKVMSWDFEAGTLCFDRQVSDSYLAALKFTPDGSRILCVGHRGGFILDAVSGDVAKTIPLPGLSSPRCVAVCSDGKLGVVAGSSYSREVGFEGKAVVVDLSSGKLLATMSGHDEGIEDVAISVEHSIVVTAGADYTARVWDLRSGRALCIWQTECSCHFCVRFVSRSKVAIGGSDGMVRIADVENLRPQGTLRSHDKRISGLCMSEDGSRVATTSDDGTVRIWSVELGKLVETLVHAGTWTQGVSFSPDGEWLATGGGNGVIKIWDSKSFRKAAEFVHDGCVGAVSFSPDSSTMAVATGLGANYVCVQDIRTGAEELRIKTAREIGQLLFSLDGRTLAGVHFDEYGENIGFGTV